MSDSIATFIDSIHEIQLKMVYMEPDKVPEKFRDTATLQHK